MIILTSSRVFRHKIKMASLLVSFYFQGSTGMNILSLPPGSNENRTLCAAFCYFSHRKVEDSSPRFVIERSEINIPLASLPHKQQDPHSLIFSSIIY